MCRISVSYWQLSDIQIYTICRDLKKVAAPETATATEVKSKGSAKIRLDDWLHMLLFTEKNHHVYYYVLLVVKCTELCSQIKLSSTFSKEILPLI